MQPKKFNPGDYIVTKDNQRGYVVDCWESEDFKKYCTIRITSGYVHKLNEDLQLDILMMKDN